MQQRRNFSAEFKAKVVLEIIQRNQECGGNLSRA
jgi:transposase-like protein